MVKGLLKYHPSCSAHLLKVLLSLFALAFLCPVNIFSEPVPQRPFIPQRRTTSPLAEWPDSIPVSPETHPEFVVGEEFTASPDSLILEQPESIAVVSPSEPVFTFNPDPTRAVWLSALFPGLGQVYNRRYWKLPIIIGGFMGLGYATSWNNGLLRDYTRAYADIMDNDPSTNSYMDFFPPTTQESDLNKTWLQNVMKSRKDFYRRNRDLCIICMVGVYLLAMVDAYVDASLSHFDISPALSMDVAPTLIQDARDNRPAVGMHWALTF